MEIIKKDKIYPLLQIVRFDKKFKYVKKDEKKENNKEA